MGGVAGKERPGGRLFELDHIINELELPHGWLER